MKTKENKTESVWSKLSDILWIISMDIEKSRCLADDISETLDMSTDSTKEAQIVLYSLSHTRMHHNILLDYLVRLDKRVNNLLKFVERKYEEERAETI